TRSASVLNGGHARAGRSPRASEVGAKRRTGRLTARARVTRWNASTDVCLLRASAARHCCQPSEMPGAVQRGCLAVIDAGGGKSVVEQADVVAVPLAEVPADRFRWHVRIRARRAQALAIVTRRDETARGLGRRRR
ncbi:MAG: hypothetical protein OXC14_19065, partial [Rhodospirillaceae bacterium]|nr:hypothetical protein [Rhodospirillaceae bacterium]